MLPSGEILTVYATREEADAIADKGNALGSFDYTVFPRKDGRFVVEVYEKSGRYLGCL